MRRWIACAILCDGVDRGGQKLSERDDFDRVGMRIFPAPDGGYVIVGNTNEYRRAFETVLIKTDGEGSTVAFSPDGSLLASDGYENQVYLWGYTPVKRHDYIISK
jgi:WD40 repeat protein